MGEIKSTLELVMERTRHLSLSDEDKARQQKEDFDKRLQGLLQQYADGALTLSAVQERIASLQADLNVRDLRALATGIIHRIDPNQENQRWLDLLDETAPAGKDPIKATLSEYSEQKQTRLRETETRLVQSLAEKHGISGAAVKPNPQKDGDCRSELAALRFKVAERLEDIVRHTLSADQT